MQSADLADAVSRLRRAMRRAARAADPAAGLSVAQLEMLSCMAENPGVTPGPAGPAAPAGAQLGSDPRPVAAPGRPGHRTGGAGDRRTASLDLTAVGEAAVVRWKTVNEQLLSLAFATLPAASRDALQAALPALADLAGAVDALADDALALALATDPAAGTAVDPVPVAAGPAAHGRAS